ncbi:response regulator transcription factor [Piscinibacter aquaticus]|uniref:Response regulator transcription factor n=1 Tax=Piscinibacter aquaticus TaxID=392597 RepID=A0A5C6U202_9BURK|nr:response regulator transcription factor [Piscinibacter aquaticus]
MLRVLLADDHPVVRAGYQRLLEQDGDIRVVADVGDGAAAYAACIEHEPDVVVADLSMPGGGMDLIQRLCQRHDDARVLVFSMHDSSLLVRRALEAGARGYIPKSSPPQRLIEGVRALHAGRRYLAPELPAELLGPRPAVDEGERTASLSAREFEVFRLLAQGLSAADCAQRLNVSAKTVSNHQSAIKDKLGVATSAALAHWRCAMA